VDIGISTQQRSIQICIDDSSTKKIEAVKILNGEDHHDVSDTNLPTALERKGTTFKPQHRQETLKSVNRR
jgi:hypothetical protein